ncbi:hypothetical protein Tco_0938002 [Tanacetum coccineum]|uniref:Uncharacterized protein n=1 Tax=Tanacetum coccineum TaxID=301880 RepID=A0ABQ5DGU7_9ASTR
MDDPNITMEEYIRLEEEKSRRSGKVYNWETATYCKIWYDEDVHDLRSIETEFPAIVFNDELTSEVALSCEPMVIPFNDNKIDFEIICLKIIQNDNDRVNMSSFLSPEPTVGYLMILTTLKILKRNFQLLFTIDCLRGGGSEFDLLN